MSFVKRAVKKVFKFGKRLLKKTVSFAKRAVKSDWFKVAAIVGLSLFTAGLASGGFSAFTTAMEVGGGGIPGFFAAVGETISAGYSSIAGVLTGKQSFGEAFGAASKTLGAEVAPAASDAASNIAAADALGQATGSGLLPRPNIPGVAGAGDWANMTWAEMVGSHVAMGGKVAGSSGGFGGFLGTLGKSLMADTTMGSMLRMGVVTGMQGYFRQKELDKAEGYYRNRRVWGNAAYGSDGGSIGLPMPTFPDAEQLAAENTPAQGGGAPQGAPLLPFPDGQQNPAQVALNEAQGQTGAPQQASPGVPGQQTQPPPANQPQQAPGQPPPGSQLENMGLLA